MKQIGETLFTSIIEQTVLLTKPPDLISETAPNKQERQKVCQKIDRASDKKVDSAAKHGGLLQAAISINKQFDVAVEKQEMEAGEEGPQQWVHHRGGICQMQSLSLAQVASLICFLFILYSFIWSFLILPLFCLFLGMGFWTICELVRPG